MTIRKSSNSGIPFGNTSGRPGSPSLGQPYFNGQTARLELYTDTGWQNIVQETPGVASASGTYNQSAGSGTFTVAGTNFVDGAIAYAVGTNGTEYQATTTTYNSLVQLTVVFSNLSPEFEPYDIKITNPSNLFGLLPDAFFINDSPVWSTTSGSLGTYTGSSIQLSATDDESNSITYAVTSGSLPSGLSLSSSGLISGTSTANSGTYNFTVSASDGINTAVTRSFSVIVPPIVTGGTITISGDYRIHRFTSSSTLSTNLNSLAVDYLVVAGGGGAGGAGAQNSSTGGGGAGGYLSSTSTLSAASYSITVGAGGSGGPAEDAAGSTTILATKGSNSQFGSIATSTGGGASPNSNSHYNGSERNGGSGAGGTGNSRSGAGQIGFPGTGTSGQGNNGGNSWYGQNGGFYSGGGGGGAGAAGGNASSSSTTAGVGGAGLQWLDGNNYAGGGAGGTYNSSSFSSGGAGGGGNSGGNATTPGGNGTANTGGGGGGTGGAISGSSQPGGSGGAGIVIVRYLKSAVGL